MLLSEYISELKHRGLLSGMTGEMSPDTEITFVTDDSREAAPGCLFVCKGTGFRQEYLRSAEEKGAAACLSAKTEDCKIPCLVSDELLTAFAAVSGLSCGFPSKELKVVGVTGTKGKTTTCEMIKTILSVSSKCAVIGTNGVDTTKKLYDNTLTTPESLRINTYLREAADNGASAAVVETSAQAFKMHRTDFLNFEVGVFTNFGLDHIGPKEHPDADDYFRCKMMLFAQCAFAAVYGDGEEFPKILPYISHIPYVTFGLSPENDYYADNIGNDGHHVFFDLHSKNINGTFRLSMLGDFNVLNALAAVACCERLGASAEDMKKALERVFVSGRMEIFEGGGRTVIVDYAHNRMSYELLLENVRRDFPGRRIVSVFGCPGTKALNRRRDMGETAAKYSDFTVITAEDPDTEPPEKTMDEIASYIEPSHRPYVKIASRAEAVEYAVKNSRKGDVVLILGKGNEKTMMYYGKFLPHEGDADIAARLVASLGR